MNRANVLFYDVQVCDSCDKKNNCAHISLGITNFVWVICKDCLNEYRYGFYSETEIRKNKLKRINKLYE